MTALTRFFAWLRSLFGGGKQGVARKIERHLQTLRVRRLTYEDQRRELEEKTTAHEKQKDTTERQLRKLVEEGKATSHEARKLGLDLDVLKETITDLIARSNNRRALEDLLRRVISAGEELTTYLPVQPDIGVELEASLAEQVGKMGAEPAQALGRLLAFMEDKLESLKGVRVRHEVSERDAEMPDSLREMVAEKEQRDREAIEAEEVAFDVTQREQPQTEQQHSRREGFE